MQRTEKEALNMLKFMSIIGATKRGYHQGHNGQVFS